MSAIVGGPPPPVYQDRWYQTEAIDALFAFFKEHGGNNPDGTPKKANPLICLPTGTGKSLVIARFVQLALQMFPWTRVFMSTHVKELIAQNAGKMLDVWPNAPLGIYSSGLKRKDHAQSIIFGGVQSCVNNVELFGFRDLLVIDEAHLVGEEGRYLKFILGLMEANPYLKVIGLSATPYRLGLGPMTNGDIFTHIAYDLCNIEGFARLMAEGYLCPLIPKRTQTQLDISGVSKGSGDLNQTQLQAAVDKYETTYAALCELVTEGADRWSWLVFASGTEHADHIGEMLNNLFGIPTVVIHSKKTDDENAQALADWKSGKARCAVNMNSLTTGVDHPPCDLIAMLRPTISTGLWVQMLGRGTRPYSCFLTNDPALARAFPFVKANCKVLDFAGNTARLGPINDPVIPRKRGEGPPGDAPVRICGHCGAYNHASARICVVCTTEFPTSENIDNHASTLELIRSGLPQIEYYNVQRVVMVPHVSKAGNNSIKVAYYCGLQTFYEWISVESPVPFMRKKGRDWFRQRYHYNSKPAHWTDDVPPSNDEVLQLSYTNNLRPPMRLKVWVNKPTPEIQGYEF